MQSTPDDVTMKFTNHNILELPFPSHFVPEKFLVVGHDNGVPRFLYMGRSEFKTMYDDIMKSINGGSSQNVAIVGPIGSGKSHLLAAFVVCMRQLREAFPHDPRFMPVIYVSDCQDVLSEQRLVEYMKQQLQLEDIPPRGFESWDAVTTRKQLESIVDNHTCRMLFVYDNWNAVFDDGAQTGMMYRLEDFRRYSKKVLGLSHRRNDEKKMRHLYGDNCVINMYRGLPRNEFDVWRRVVTDRWRGLVVDEENESKLDEFYELTGGLPLLMTRLLTYEGVSTLEEAYEKYNNDAHEKSFGGKWIRNELKQFFKRTYLKGRLYEIWTSSCFGKKKFCVNQDLADYRFFKRAKDDELDYYSPICGFIRRYLNGLLKSFGWEMFVKLLSEPDLQDFLFQTTSNSSLQGLAYETYCLNVLATSHIHMVTGMAIEDKTCVRSLVFEGCSPTIVQLRLRAKMVSDVTVFIPTKWNLPFIHCCMRHFHKEMATASADGDSKCKKRKASSSCGVVAVPATSARVLVVYAIHISLLHPQERIASLEFYVRPSPDATSPAEIYARHNLGDDVTVRHVFVWVTPHDVTAGDLPDPPRGAIAFDQKCVRINNTTPYRVVIEACR